MKTRTRILKAGLWAGLLLVMSCVIPMVSAVFPILEGFADQAYARDVKGTVFEDTNQNGIYEYLIEPGIGGVTITLSDGQTYTTNISGSYSFTINKEPILQNNGVQSIWLLSNHPQSSHNSCSQ